MDTINKSDSVIQDLIVQWNEELAEQLIPIDVFLGVYLIIGCLGNILVIYIYSFRMKVKMDDRYFVLVLAVTDVIVCLCGSSFSMSRNILPVSFRGDLICKFAWFISKVMNAISVMIILLISIQRFLKICRPFGPQLNDFRKKMALGAMIVLCLVSHAPIFVFYGEIKVENKQRNITGLRCGRIHRNKTNIEFIGYIYLLIVFAVAAGSMALITILSFLTGKRIYDRIKHREKRFVSYVQSEGTSESQNDLKEDDTTATSSAAVRSESRIPSITVNDDTSTKKKKRKKSKRSFKEKHRYTILFLLISGICIATYLPTLTVNAAINLDSDYVWNDLPAPLRTFYLFLFQVYLINHMINPFIYGFFDTAFRLEVKNSLLRLIGIKRDIQRALSSRRGSTNSQGSDAY